MKAAKHSVADASPRPFTEGVARASAETAFEAARATIGGLHRLEPVHVTRRLVVFLLLLAALAGVCALTWSIAWQRGLDTLRQNAAARVDRTTAELKSTLDRYEYLPYLLSRHPFVQEVLADPNPRFAARADRYLADLNTHARATATYIIQSNGRCVAASNWNGPDSFVGAEYLFRPYFVDALAYPQRLMVSAPYLSATGTGLCVTLSIFISYRGEPLVFGADLDWERLATSAAGLLPPSA